MDFIKNYRFNSKILIEILVYTILKKYILLLRKKVFTRIWIYMFLSVVLWVVPVLNTLGLTPFYQNALKALRQLKVGEFNTPRVFCFEKQKLEFSAKVNFIANNSVGFYELVYTLKRKSPVCFESTNIVEIGIAYGDIKAFAAGVSPNYLIYVVYTYKGNKKEWFLPIIYNSMIADQFYALNQLDEMIKERNTIDTNLFILALIPLCTLFGVLAIIKKKEFV